MPFRYRGQHKTADTDISRYLQGKRRSAPSPRHARSESPNRPLIASVAALSVAAVIAGYFVLLPHTVTVEINGTPEDVTVGSTIEKLIHDGYANPTRGD